MQGFLLKTLVLLFLGLGVGLAASWNTTVKLHPDLPTRPVLRPPVAPDTGAPAPTGTTAPTGPAAPAGTDGKANQGITPVPHAPAPETTPPQGNAATPQPPAHTAADGFFITLDEAKKKFDSQQAIFIDARAFAEYKDGHIRGAMHMDKARIAGSMSKIRNYLPGSELVIYCHGAECTDSEAVIKRLQALHLNLGPYYIIKDGFPGWKAANYPVDTGDEVGYQ
jgi:rhodanese-related sulfurtransferase